MAAACKCPPALGLDSRHAPFPEGVHVVVVSRDGTSTELQLRALPCGCLDPSAFEGKELDKHDIIFSVKKIIKEAITAQGGDVPRGRASVGTLLQAYKVACETSSEEEDVSSSEEEDSDEEDSEASSEEDSAAASKDKKKTKTSRKNKGKIPSPDKVKRRKIQADVSTPLQPAASSSSSSSDPKDVISQQWLLDLAKTLSNHIWIQGPDADGTLHQQVQNLMEQRASTIKVYIQANIESMKRGFVEKSGVTGPVTKAVAIKLMEGIDNQALLDSILVEVYNILGSKILENIAVLRRRWTSAVAAQPTPAGN